MPKHILRFLPKFESLLYWLSLLLLVFIPLYPKFPLFNVSGTFVAIRIEDLLIGLDLVLWAVYIIAKGLLKTFLRHRLFQAMLAFFLVGLVSLLSGILVTRTVAPALGFLHFLRRVEFMMLLPLNFFAVRDRRQVKVCLGALSAVVLLVNLYAFGQEFFNWPVISTTNSEFSKGQILYLTEGARVNSTFAGHYDLAVFLVMILSVLAAMFFYLPSTILKFWVAILGSVSFVVLVMTAARLSFVAAVAGVLTSFTLTGKKIFILIFIGVAAAALVYPSQLRDRFVSTITINLKQGGQRYEAQTEAQKIRSELNIPTLHTGTATTSAKNSQAFEASDSAVADIAPGEPVDTTQLGVYRSFAIRVNYEWPAAVRAFLKNPLLGTGYSSLGIATDNDFLRLLGEVGILGTWAFALCLTELVRQVRANYRAKDRLLKFFSAGVLAMITAFLVNALFIDVFESSKVASLFWMICGLNLAAGKIREDAA